MASGCARRKINWLRLGARGKITALLCPAVSLCGMVDPMSAARLGANEIPAPPLDDDTRRFVEGEVDATLAEVAQGLGERDRAWLRERLIEQTLADGRLVSLILAASPRNVDESGHVLRAPRRREPNE